MSHAYLITTLATEENFEVDVDYFMTLLTARWNNAKVSLKTETDAKYLLHFYLDEFAHLVGGLQDDRRTISIDNGELHAIAEFSIWYKTNFAPSPQLYLFLSSLEYAPVELRDGITTEEVVQAIRQPRPDTKFWKNLLGNLEI
jgi:hypothetical protein